MFDTDYTSRSLRDLKKIIGGSAEVDALMKRKFAALEKIDMEHAVIIKHIKLVRGISSEISESLSKNGFDPCVYEYRDFPRKYPYRVYFVKKNKTLLILRVFRHREIKNKLAKTLLKSIKEEILK